MKSLFRSRRSSPVGNEWIISFYGIFLRRNFRWYGDLLLFTRMDRYFDSMDNGDSRICCWFFIAPRWHKTSALTVAEYITRRLGVNTQKDVYLSFLFISLFTTGSFLYPVAKIVEVSTGMPLDLCIPVVRWILYCICRGWRTLGCSVNGCTSVYYTDGGCTYCRSAFFWTCWWRCEFYRVYSCYLF